MLEVSNLWFCYILLQDEVRFVGSALSLDFEAKSCENM